MRVVLGVLFKLLSVIIGKIIFYFFFVVVEKITNYFSKKRKDKAESTQKEGTLAINPSVMSHSEEVKVEPLSDNVNEASIVKKENGKDRETQTANAMNEEKASTTLENDLKNLFQKSSSSLREK